MIYQNDKEFIDNPPKADSIISLSKNSDACRANRTPKYGCFTYEHT